MPKTIFQKFSQTPDTGNLKNNPGEYQSLQNIRGWGGLGSKRRCVRGAARVSCGIMGMFDLKIDGDPVSPDKILAITNCGDFVLYDYSELSIFFDYLFYSTGKWYLQSPDLNWWDMTIDSIGSLNATVVTAPSSTITEDIVVLKTERMGFRDSTGTWKLTVDGAGSTYTERFGLAALDGGEITDTRAFETGFGFVYEDTGLVKWRISVDNDGIISTTIV